MYVQGKYFRFMLGEHLKVHFMVTLKHGRHHELTTILDKNVKKK